MRAILTYHSIDASGSVISIAPDVFDEHVRWLASDRVRVVSLDDLLSRDRPVPLDSRDQVAVTFDDGFANSAGPFHRLLDEGLPAAVFVVTGHAGRTNAWGGRGDAGVPLLPLLDWGALGELAGRGATIGAHTRTHARLTDLTPERAAAEMEGSADDIRKGLGVDARYFAYPYGAMNPSVSALAAVRFAASLTARFAPVTPDTPLEAIPRLDMYYFRRHGDIDRFGGPGFAGRLSRIGLRRRIREALT